MSTEHRMIYRDNMHGERIEPVLTITVEGFSDVFRIAEVLRSAQCDFAEHGYSIQRSLRRKWGVRGHDALFVRMTGRTWLGKRPESPSHPERRVST